MDDKFNTIAGWTLFGGVVALGFSSLSGHIFEADKPHRPEKMGYAIEGVVVEGAGGEAEVPLATLLAAADPAKGEGVFAKCKTCHSIEAGGANGIGPNLHAVMGKPIAKHAGFSYSADLAGKGGNWEFANMDAWLKSPKAFASGTKMSFAGLGKPEDRANVIAYLNAQGSNLPLPAAEAAAPVAGAPGADGPVAGAAGDPKAAGGAAQPDPAASAGSTKSVGSTATQ